MEDLRISIAVPDEPARQHELRSLTAAFQKRIEGLGLRISLDQPSMASDEEWHLMARLEHLNGGRLSIAARPGAHLSYGQIQATYSEPNCSTCSVKRQRRVTYLLAQGDEVIQVGSSCLRFVLEPEAEKRVRADGQKYSEHSTAGQGSESPLTLRDWLAQVAAVVRLEGKFVKASENEESSTAALARAALKGAAADLRPIPFDRARADRLIAFVRETVASERNHSDFDRHLLAAYSSDLVDDARMNLAASAWLRHYGLAGSQHIGDPDDAFELEAFLFSVSKPFERGKRKWRTLLFEDVEGHSITWFTPGDTPMPGKTYMLSGVVSRHNEFGGRQRSIVTHCKAREITGELAAV